MSLTCKKIFNGVTPVDSILVISISCFPMKKVSCGIKNKLVKGFAGANNLSPNITRKLC